MRLWFISIFSLQNKLSTEDQMNDANVELAQVRLQVDRSKDDKTRLQDELSAVKKVSSHTFHVHIHAVFPALH